VLALTHVPHGFVIIDAADPEADTLVLAETVHANFTLSDASQVDLYKKHWSQLEKMAAYTADAQQLLSDIAVSVRQLSPEAVS
jgi:hypothetical protein